MTHDQRTAVMESLTDQGLAHARASMAELGEEALRQLMCRIQSIVDGDDEELSLIGCLATTGITAALATMKTEPT
jgi:hypothetical protein